MPESPQLIAERGETIYRERYREAYEREFPGQFVAIDVQSGAAFVAPTPEQAIQNARASNPQGFVHLIKIGFVGVYRSGNVSSRADANWIFSTPTVILTSPLMSPTPAIGKFPLTA